MEPEWFADINMHVREGVTIFPTVQVKKRSVREEALEQLLIRGGQLELGFAFSEYLAPFPCNQLQLGVLSTSANKATGLMIRHHRVRTHTGLASGHLCKQWLKQFP